MHQRHTQTHNTWDKQNRYYDQLKRKDAALITRIALRAIVDCGVSPSNAAHASQSPQSSNPLAGRRSQGRLTESAVIAHAQQLSVIYIAGRLFNGLTANDR